MLWLVELLLAAIFVHPALAIHASEAGVVDWYKPLVGDALTGKSSLSPVFHRIEDSQGSTRSLVLTATASNVLAALHPENGTIGAHVNLAYTKLHMNSPAKCSMETSIRNRRSDTGLHETEQPYVSSP